MIRILIENVVRLERLNDELDFDSNEETLGNIV
jgi:hypothetical protein